MPFPSLHFFLNVFLWQFFLFVSENGLHDDVRDWICHFYSKLIGFKKRVGEGMKMQMCESHEFSEVRDIFLASLQRLLADII